MVSKKIFLIIMMLISTIPIYAGVGDFFCMSDPENGNTPIQYDKSIKNCSTGKMESNKVCHQSVVCTYISSDIRNQIVAAAEERRAGIGSDGGKNTLSTGLTFGKLTEKEVGDILSSGIVGQSEFHSSVVTCSAMDIKSNYGPICPTPNSCKGDVFYKPTQASVNPAGMVEELNKALSGQGNSGSLPTRTISK